MKSNRNWLTSGEIIFIFILQLLTSLAIMAGKLGDIKYVILLNISWSHVAVTEIIKIYIIIVCIILNIKNV